MCVVYYFFLSTGEEILFNVPSANIFAETTIGKNLRRISCLINHPISIIPSAESAHKLQLIEECTNDQAPIQQISLTKPLKKGRDRYEHDKSWDCSFIPVAAARALQSISQQNNVGASLYNQGNYPEAVLVFKQAISASKIFLTHPLEEVEPSSTSVEQCLSVLVLPSQTAHTHDFGSTKHPTVYAKHLTWVSPCDSRKRREFLSKARGLYSLAYSIPQREQKQDIIDVNLLPLFVQAILNNLGQCYASLDDTVNSVACFELLLKSLIVFQQDLNGAHNLGACDNRLYHECSNTCIFENTLFLILKIQGFAPAA
ncbi:tetratricopeptide repeat protein [Nitzschia inconspicua]|uniref:Tetratricopeptide repeat protein n=1 Tax=Nitzschia inconspicua TaxID=303405 RepID=A0A9K3LPW7_9STRA|nr:tetratricopeptide repeat protein [Nitzschia inconspicua]